jgi:hypothetical protein
MLPDVFVAKAGLPIASNAVMQGAVQNGHAHHPILDEDLDRESRLKKVRYSRFNWYELGVENGQLAYVDLK